MKLPLFFPKQIKSLIKRLNPVPFFYDESGVLIYACSSLVLHNIKGSRCVWCDRSIVDLKNDIDKVEGIAITPTKILPQPDFNSPTTLTANAPQVIVHDVIVDPDQDLRSEFGSISSMDLAGVTAYCMRCKIKVSVMDPSYVDSETRRGVRHYLKGSCAICGSNINAIVKR